MKPAVALIGPGKLGCAVGKKLHWAGYPLTTVIARQPQQARAACAFIGCAATAATSDLKQAASAELLLLSVTDDAIAEVATQLSEQIDLSGKLLIHFSGLHPASIMSPESCCQRLSLHPLLPFADPQTAFLKLDGCPWTIEGDNSALPQGQRLISDLGGTSYPLPGAGKGLYHAAASIGSNFMVSLIDWACALLQQAGIAREQTLPLLLPLLQATLDNVRELGPQQGLTGPIVRGDSATVAAHLHALAHNDPRQLNCYQQLAGMTIALAQTSGRLEPAAAEQLQNLLSAAADKQNC